MSGTGSQNFALKLALSDANTVARALESYYREVAHNIRAAGGVANAPALTAELGRLETIIRRDFDQEPPKVAPFAATPDAPVVGRHHVPGAEHTHSENPQVVCRVPNCDRPF